MVRVKRWHRVEGNKISWDHEYMLPEEVPAKTGKYKVFEYDLPKSRLKQLHGYLSEKLFKKIVLEEEKVNL